MDYLGVFDAPASVVVAFKCGSVGMEGVTHASVANGMGADLEAGIISHSANRVVLTKGVNLYTAIARVVGIGLDEICTT